MKQTLKLFAAVLAALTVLADLTIPVQAADDYTMGDWNYAVRSAKNTFDYPTNHLYSRAIIATSAKIVTNMVPMDVRGGPYLAIQLTANQQTEVETNVVVEFYQSVLPATITNSTTGAFKGADLHNPATPIQPWLTVPLDLDGTTPVSTNIVVNKGALPYLYVYSIQAGAGSILTNYSIAYRVEK